MREIEVKAVVDDIASRREAVERAGGELTFEGRLVDARYCDAEGRLMLDDHVLRLRIYESAEGNEGFLDWKGPTQYENGYKVREELSTSAGDPEALAKIIEHLGFTVVMKIERMIWQYSLHGATVRFEEYPRMDPLVEVEGSEEEIEKAIEAIGLPRTDYTTDRLTDFVSRYELRTGWPAILST